MDRQEEAAHPSSAARWADRALIVTITAAAGLLACQELFDADTWWHLRAGQWILSNRRLPYLDPFSFGSSDRPWIDLAWIFQVFLALSYQAGRVGGMILLAAAACSATLLIVLCATVRGPRSWLMALIWLPALLLLSTRVQPRPEVFSLLLTATYLAILDGCDRRPGWVWVLLPVQLLWVNMHGLFVLGPVLLAAYVADGGKRRWRRLAPAFAAVLAACLVNPYGLRGALFPLELLPKITAWGGPYKAYIGEFHDPRSYMQNDAIAVATRNLFCRTEFFLFLLIPISLLVPGIWQAWSTAAPLGAAPLLPPTRRWLGGMALAVVLAILSTLTLPLEGTPVWVVELGRALPWSFPVLGCAAALALARRSGRAALLVACGGMALGGAIPWLQTQWIAPGAAAAARSGNLMMGWTVGCMTVPAAGLALVLLPGAGARVFRLIVSAAFGFLALQAVRNASFFALVSGFVIARNFHEWAARLGAGNHETGIAFRVDRALGVMLTAVLWLAIGAGAAGWFVPVNWGLFPIGLRERPLTFAHAAARFAGRPGMPGEALVLELAQAAVYLFHNAPERKPFIDPRLEVPSPSTFATYVQLDQWLNVGHPGWSEVIERMGNPLILLDHAKSHGAEATLLIDPRWRCVSYDAVASVFLPRSRAALEPMYPTIDFAARHFQGTALGRAAIDGLEARGEARGLFLMGWALLPQKEATWTHRIPVLLLAGDRAREALTARPDDARAWLALGDALWSQTPDLLTQPPGPVDPWDPARSLCFAQATFAYRRSVALDPALRSALSTLRRSLAFRGMTDAPAHEAEARQAALPWGVVDRIAITYLHRGEPAAALRLWQGAGDCPSPALRLTRIAEAHLVDLDYEASRAMFRAALDHDRGLGEAWYGLALLHLQAGQARETFSACREGLTCVLTQPQRASLENIQALTARFVQP
jgi:tetratricopeptide (TPR) repeat protein